MEETEREWLQKLAIGDRAALDFLFRQYYVELCRAAYRIVMDAAAAEDVVQEVFVTLWRQRERTAQIDQPAAYLRRAVRNRALNYHRDHRARTVQLTDAPEPVTSADITGRPLDQAELDELLERAIAALPERSRLVFVLSRFESLSQKEIASQMGISVKTVENQMTRALRLLREYLGPYLGVMLILLSSFTGTTETPGRQQPDISITTTDKNGVGDFTQLRVHKVKQDPSPGRTNAS